MNKHPGMLAAVVGAAVAALAGCVGAVPTSTGDDLRPIAMPKFTVSQTSSGNMVYVSRSINWTGVNFPQNWRIDLDAGTAHYTYYSAIDRSRQYETAFNWRPLPSTMGGGFQFTYGVSIPFVGDQVSGDLHATLGILVGMMNFSPATAGSAAATAVNRVPASNQKLIVLDPVPGVPVGTVATIQIQPQDGPRIMYTYEYR